jgi:ADP-ribosylglycohydrolase
VTSAAASNAFGDRVLGCLLGGLVGDAMGTPTENMEPVDIARQFGWVATAAGAGTDDTAMRAILCDALLATDGYAGPDDWADQWVAHADVFTGALRPKFFVSVLQTAEKLAMGDDSRCVATGNMPSSSSAMCIAPVGIVNAGNPRAASEQARWLGSLIHQGPVSFCADAAAAIAAAVAVAVDPGATLDDVLEAARTTLHPGRAGVMRDLIGQTLSLARQSNDYETFRREYHETFRQRVACDARETVPAVFGLLALADGDVQRCVEYAANFGRDTDTIGTMVGSISGALAGAKAMPAAWSGSVDPVQREREWRMSAKLVALAIAKAEDQRARSAAALARLTVDVASLA